MITKPTDRIKDIDIKEHVDFIYAEALGNIIELGAIPTAVAPLLSDNEIGRYSGILYFRKGVSIYVVTPSSVITIT